MDLIEGQRLILESAPQDWETWVSPTYPGPDTHGSLATNTRDIALEIMWGRELTANFTEPWAAKFPDSSAHSFYFEATYHGSLIYQQVLVDTDGGRYILPLPEVIPSGGAFGSVVYQTSEADMLIPRLLYGLGGAVGYGPDQGLQLAGIVLSDT